MCSAIKSLSLKVHVLVTKRGKLCRLYNPTPGRPVFLLLLAQHSHLCEHQLFLANQLRDVKLLFDLRLRISVDLDVLSAVVIGTYNVLSDVA